MRTSKPGNPILWIWQKATDPSPLVQELDKRRQAALLSALLLLLILLAITVELITVATIENEHYTGYRTTVVLVCLLLIFYILSRSRYFRLAGVLTILSLSAVGFLSAIVWPEGIRGGLLDYIIISIWLGSLFLGNRELPLLVVINLVGILLFTFFVPGVKLNEVLIGPFSFTLVTSMLIILITRHRDLVEQDRRSELEEKEKRSRHEAARSRALLHVAERLNAQLDLDTLLTSISEEVAVALSVPVSLVTLYDRKKDVIKLSAGMGVSPALLQSFHPIPRAVFEQATTRIGENQSTPHNLKNLLNLPNIELYKNLKVYSAAFAVMNYDDEFIGSLNALTDDKNRAFTEEERLLLQGIADQAALAIVNTRLYKDAHRRLEHLQALRAIDIAIASDLDLRNTFEVLLTQITRQLSADAAVILILNKDRQVLEYGASTGFHTPTLRFTRLKVGEGMAGRAAQLRQVVRVDDLRTDPQTLVRSPSLAKEGFASYAATPLIAKGQVIGVLEIFHRTRFDPDEEWLEFLETLAGQAAIAIENTSLLSDLQQVNEDLVKAYDSTIEGWSHALDLRDKETEGHTLRVTKLTIELAQSIGFSEAEQVHIRRGALLHDIGKMGVPDRILLKEGPLLPEEWQVMRKHPDYAHEMLLPIEYLRPAIDIPYCHHEKWDGSGYPRGLKGKEIPLSARIFAIVDVWDALTSDRPYRPAWTKEKALAFITGEANTHFDPHLVAMFIDLIKQNEGKAD